MVVRAKVFSVLFDIRIGKIYHLMAHINSWRSYFLFQGSQLIACLLSLLQVRVLCEKAKEILMDESNVQVCFICCLVIDLFSGFIDGCLTFFSL